MECFVRRIHGDEYTISLLNIFHFGNLCEARAILRKDALLESVTVNLETWSRLEGIMDDFDSSDDHDAYSSRRSEKLSKFRYTLGFTCEVR